MKNLLLLLGIVFSVMLGNTALAASAMAGLGFISNPQSVIPGACSGLVTVGVVDVNGQFITAAGSVPITVSSSATIYRDNACKNQAPPPQIAGGAKSTVFYFKSNNLGLLPITVNTTAKVNNVVLHSATQSETILPGTVTVNQVSPASQSAVAGQNFFITYSFTAAPLGVNDNIVANFVNSSGTVVFQDSFQPPTGTAQWSGKVTYPRFVSIPPEVPAGNYSINIGLQNSSNSYIPLAMGSGVKASSSANLCSSGTVSVSASTVAVGSSVTIPPQAVSAGYTHPVFSDNFSSLSTISPDGTGNYNWYTPNFFTASATLPSSGYSLKTDDGTYLSIDTDASGYSDGIATAAPGHTGQAWQHGYFEASLKFNPSGNQGTAWPAFWSWAIEDATGNDKSGATRGPYAELDFMEAYPSGSTIDVITTLHQWLNNGSKQNSNNVPTLPSGTNYNQFHTYGCLWTPDKVVWYFDNKPVTTLATGPGTQFTALEQDHMFLILGSGLNWPMGVQFVHVWTK